MLSQGDYSCLARELTYAQPESLLLLSQVAYSCLAMELIPAQPMGSQTA
jgi:hypothetical protein